MSSKHTNLPSPTSPSIPPAPSSPHPPIKAQSSACGAFPEQRSCINSGGARERRGYTPSTSMSCHRYWRSARHMIRCISLSLASSARPHQARSRVRMQSRALVVRMGGKGRVARRSRLIVAREYKVRGSKAAMRRSLRRRRQGPAFRELCS